MNRISHSLALWLLAALPAAATDFVPVSDQDQFVELVEGRDLRIWLFQLSLRVSSDGRIEGEAMGDPVTGDWTWQDGYFCREMHWSGTDIPMNCQLVEVRGTDDMRFTEDRGKGKSASFKLK